MASKNIFQRQLKLSRIVRFTGDAAERATGRIDVRIVPVRVVQNIEHLEAELQGLRFVDSKILAQAHIPGEETGAAQAVAGLNAECAGSGLGEGGFVEPGCEIGKRGWFHRGVTHEIVELIAAPEPDAGNILAGSHGPWHPRLKLVDPRDFPAA